MWTSHLFWRLFVVYAGLNLTLAVGFLAAVTSWQRSQVNEQVEQRLSDTAFVLRSHIMRQLEVILNPRVDQQQREQAESEMQQLVTDLSVETHTRLTIIKDDGEVLADSNRDPKTMTNHRDRPELITARAEGRGTASRRSPTLGIAMFYFALPVRVDGQSVAFVRVAMELETINRRVASIRWFLWIFALTVGTAAMALTYTMVGRIIRPLTHLTKWAQSIAAGIDEDPVAVESRDEIGLLAEAFNQMQGQLTERVRQLRENNNRLSAVLSSMDEGIIAVDSDERIQLTNDASRYLLGFVTENAVGRQLLEATRSRPLLSAVREAQKNGSTCKTEFETVGEPRRSLAVNATCMPGEPLAGVLLVLHDVTELRRLENLRQEFVANVSHELKTPLAAIKAYAETLRLGAIHDAEHNLEFARRIEEQAERLHQLILDMLQIARVESGKETFEIVDVAVEESVEASIEQCSSAAAQRNITMRTEPPNSPLTVRADEDGVRAILENLLDNAVKYTPEGGEVVTRWYSEHAFATIEVRDNGIGISRADQGRVFERFFRVDKARSRELGGTGLGLSIVKHLCQAFGGSVTLESQLGKGSCFKVRLPLV